MGLYKYSHKADEAKVSRSQGYDLDVSYKDLANVATAIKHKSVAKARVVLQSVIDKKTPIAYTKFNKGMGHRSQLGGKKGRFPKKECRAALQLLDNAVSNAVKKGFDETALFVRHAQAYKQNTLPRYRRTWVGGAVLGYGKQAIRSDYVTARMEITLEERPGLKEAGKLKEIGKKKSPKKEKKNVSAAEAEKPPAAKENSV